MLFKKTEMEGAEDKCTYIHSGILSSNTQKICTCATKHLFSNTCADTRPAKVFTYHNYSCPLTSLYQEVAKLYSSFRFI